MIGRTLLAISILTLVSSAQAAWDVGGGLENFQWKEYPAGGGIPKESGVRSALFVNWTQEGSQGTLFAWRAKLYGGTVNYDTFAMCNCASNGAPVSTQTDYTGAVNEGQMVYRDNLGAYKLDYLSGLGLDTWRRRIRNAGSDQIEDYSIWFLRAGLRLAKSRSEAGFHGELGIKYPISTRENVHLTSSYSLDGFLFTSNPNLSPKGAVSGYVEFGYRINARFDALGYYDSWRFGRSDNVTARDTAGSAFWIYQPKSNMDVLGAKLLVSF